MQQHLIFCLFLLTFSTTTFSQSPYNLSLKKEAVFFGSGFAIYGLGVYLDGQLDPLSDMEINSLMKADVNGFDRIAIGNNSTGAADLSDIFENALPALPLLFLANKKSRSHFGQIALMFGEVYIANKGLTNTIKFSAKRTRPFVYDPNIDIEDKRDQGARASFISGHTSDAASECFFAAKVFADFYPDSQWKPVVWGTAAAIPAFMGYLRVRAGKHFPTDVIGGYVVGAAIGVLVPHLHRNKALAKQGLSLNLGYNGFHLAWQFDNKPKYQ